MNEMCSKNEQKRKNKESKRSKNARFSQVDKKAFFILGILV